MKKKLSHIWKSLQDQERTDYLIAAAISIMTASFLAGAALHRIMDQNHMTKETSIQSSAENWGLGFSESGTPPTGNATSEELKQYHAAYLQPTEDKVDRKSVV